MYNFTSLSSLAFIIFGCILSATSWAKSAESKFDDRFYMSKICTAYMSKDGHGYCDDGYVLKSETLEGGQVKETLLMDGIGSYGWNHTSLKKIDKDTIMSILVVAIRAVPICYLGVAIKSRTLVVISTLI